MHYISICPKNQGHHLMSQRKTRYSPSLACTLFHSVLYDYNTILYKQNQILAFREIMLWAIDETEKAGLNDTIIVASA